MLKGAISLVTILFLAGSSLVYAQDASLPRRSQADVNVRIDMRLAIAKDALELTPDQAKYWPPVADAVRTGVQARYARIAAVEQRLSQQREVDPIELFRARANVLAQRATELNKLIDAWEPLYRSLTPDQKERMRFLAQRVLPGLTVAVETGRLRGFNEGASRNSGGQGTGGTVGIAPR
jgi:LTXXQ motif family protein